MAVNAVTKACTAMVITASPLNKCLSLSFYLPKGLRSCIPSERILKAGKASVIRLSNKNAAAERGKDLKNNRQMSTDNSSPILELIK